MDVGFKRHFEAKYIPVPRDDLERIIDDIVLLIELGRDQKQSIRSVLEHVAKMIFKRFDFDEIALGLKDRTEDIYTYEVLLGYTREKEDAFRKLKYTNEDMVSDERYPHVDIGKTAELNPAEALPDNEKYLFGRPSQLKFERKNLDEFHEGDYIDVWMYDSKRKLIGWLELSRPRDGKQPARSTVRWIELVAAICAQIIEKKQAWE